MLSLCPSFCPSQAVAVPGPANHREITTPLRDRAHGAPNLCHTGCLWSYLIVERSELGFGS